MLHNIADFKNYSFAFYGIKQNTNIFWFHFACKLLTLFNTLIFFFRLKRLHCDFNLLKHLPPDWSSLVSLTNLSLSNNRLEEIPTTLWTLQCLQVLNLQRNRISSIGPLPEGAASRLRELRLSHNRLTENLDLSPLVVSFPFSIFSLHS